MRSAIAVTIAPAALVAVAVAILLVLHAAGAGFQGDPLAVVRDAAPDDRLWDVAARRGPVIGVTLLVWLAAFGLAMAVSRERAGRIASRLLALSLVYLPLTCLVAAAIEPSVGVERLLVMLGSPALAALTLAALGGYRALACACALTAVAYAVDLIAGSPLTQLSLVGPNPAGGHRFYGIGNELEATLVVLILVGTGAALSSFVGSTPPQGRQGASAGFGPAAFLVVAAIFSFVFAYGRYGADVGAAITLPLGAAVAAALLANRPRLALLAFALPIPALAILSAADLLTGANAHLTRTVLDADSGGDVLAVFGHRLREAGESFGRTILLVCLPFVVASAVVAWLRRDRLALWLRGLPAMRAGMLGALAATLVGTLANDSGALLLELGAVYLLAFVGFAWAESDRTGAARDIV
ncbi:MAG TPA: hypothetical protein VFM94_11095 [Solirubrobacterales bacterium]|nr:hypothetical protein [Solirubrobacterales bacterium]